MSEVKRCAACGKENLVREMKTCMHSQMHYYVCDSKCMDDFYNPPKKPTERELRIKAEAERDTALAELAALKGGREAVAWYTDDHLEDRSATTYSKAMADRWVAKGWRITPLYLAPPAQASAWVAETDAARDVLAERKRQMSAEGWTPEHDDEHGLGEMASAAGFYALHAHDPERSKKFTAPQRWPWDFKWWKPGSARRMLVKAGALILAEIERLDRATPTPGASDGKGGDV